MTREDLINERINGIDREMEAIDKKIKAEAKKLIEAVTPKSLEKIVEFKSQREKLAQTQYELFVIIGTGIN
ncbi:hypothetical protein MNQ98_10690 [Paenibacillus sp. N3/727]|uniref:hypothetical protein n=1 Tax=Paenibacillus sp. N3/727 TaxID=2925845 RepID=UPI001F52B5BB|nr:hypothetical protein [Paenibacillus sp. N3/727]UNK20441.1 hypothetical protein MNQ98_10690 [Paenibacillus sp. N3/727]